MKPRATQPALSCHGGRHLFAAILVFALLALAPTPDPAHPAVLRIPFRTARSMILVQGKVDGKQVTFLLDTGSLGTIVSLKLYRNLNYPLQRIHRNLGGAGVSGESVSGSLDLEFGGHRWFSQRVSVMNLDELSGILGIEHVDGLLGQDILRQFRYVRIDYHAHIVELEE
jgi:hypothetical protein